MNRSVRWGICVQKYYPFIESKEILTAGMTRMTLEDTVLSKIGSHKRTKIL